MLRVLAIVLARFRTVVRYWIPALLSLLASAPVVAQAVAAEERLAPSPRHRTSWGDPDIGGLWDHRSPLAIERPEEFADRATVTLPEMLAWRREKFAHDIEERRGEDPIKDVNQGHNAFWIETRHDLTDDPRTALLVDPPDGKLPELTPEAAAAVEASKSSPRIPFRGWNFPFEDPLAYRPAGPEVTGLSERCILGYAGPPIYAGIENQNLRIVQSPTHILLFHEDMHTPRVVQMQGRANPPGVTSLVGSSVGHWEGETLVVVTTNFSGDRPSFWDPRHGPVGSGEDLKLVERFTRIREDRLRYEYTVDDPKNYERPFTVRIPMRTARWHWYEYSCHERNESLLMTLKGARYLESLENGSAAPEQKPSPP